MKNNVKRISALFTVIVLCFCVAFEAAAAGYPDYYPNTHRNTGSHIADLLGVAKTQLGYTELNSSGNPIPSTSDGGYTKYGASFGERTVHGVHTLSHGALRRQVSLPL